MKTKDQKKTNISLNLNSTFDIANRANGTGYVVDETTEDFLKKAYDKIFGFISNFPESGLDFNNPQTEEKFRAFVNTIPVLVWTSSEDKLFNYFNQSWLDFTGRTLDEEIGNGWAEGVHPDDLDFCIKTYTEHFDKRLPFEMEYRLRRRDGKYRCVIDRGLPRYSADGKFIGYIGSCADISDFKFAQKTLIENEERFRVIFENSHSGIAFGDKEGNLLATNKSFQDLIGYTQAELETLHFSNITHTDFLQTELKYFTEIQTGDRNKYRLKKKYIKKNKSTVWVDLAVSVIRDQAGESRYLIGVVNDINDQKIAEDKLNRELNINIAINELSSALIVQATSIKDITDLTLHYASFLTKSKEGYVSIIDKQNGNNVIKSITPNLKKYFYTVRKNRVLTSSPDSKGNYKGIWGRSLNELKSFFDNSPNSEKLNNINLSINNFLSVPAIVEKNLVGQIVLINSSQNYEASDIEIIERLIRLYSVALVQKEKEERLRISEQRYRSLAAATSQIVWTTNVCGEIVNDQPLWRKYTGQSREEIKLFGWLDAVHPEDRKKIIKVWMNATELISTFKTEFRVRGENKEYRLFNLSGVPVRNSDGSVREWVGTCSDITDKRRAEELIRNSEMQLRSLNQHLERAREEERIHISREIHDELGHLLTILKFDLIELQDDLKQPSDSPQHEIIPLVGLVDSLIDSVRKIATELRPGVLDHLGIIPALDWLSQQFQMRTKIKCEYDFNQCSIELNKEETTVVFRIFQEIFTNIARHSKATLVSIKIKKEDSKIIFVIKDNGIGFDPDEKHNTGSHGLIGISERALSINGEVDISSKLGTGTIITLTINDNTLEK